MPGAWVGSLFIFGGWLKSRVRGMLRGFSADEQKIKASIAIFFYH